MALKYRGFLEQNIADTTLEHLIKGINKKQLPQAIFDI